MSNGKTNKKKEPKIQHHQINLPKGGGAIGGIGEKFQANAVTGTGTFSVPIPTSPSRSGFEPKIALTYDSGSGNSVFGLGWSLDIPEISRKTAKGLPRYLDSQDSDTFILSGAEDLVPVLETSGEKKVDEVGNISTYYYRPRIEGLYARIKKIVDSSSGNVHWEATTRDNVTSVYGETGDARITDPSEPRRVFKWLLERTYDAKDNEVVYEYAEENKDEVSWSVFEKNRIYDPPTSANFVNKHIKRIKYGPKVTPSDEYHFQVVFDYGDHPDAGGVPPLDPSTPWPSRQDPFSDHRAGFDIRTYRLCRRVIVFHDIDNGPTPVRELTLSHDPNPVATKLTSVQQKGYKETTPGNWETKTSPPVSYSYTPADPDTHIKKLDAESLKNVPQGLTGNYQFIDLEGEGLSGIFTEQAGNWYYKRNEGDGKFGPLQVQRTMPSVAKTPGAPQLTDIDGDGNLELVLNERILKGFYSYRDGKWENFQYLSLFSKGVNWSAESFS